ncbi:MAG: 23S rRNA (pseudouridine(1915)-N(3))-methyltransferase RlmH [Myxococcota bacterium]
MKLKIVVVGRDRNDPIIDAADEYLSRLRRYTPTELVEVREEPLKKGRSILEVQRTEAERLRKSIGQEGLRVALDEHGRAQTSVQLAQRLRRWTDDGVPRVSLFVGGPSGLHPEIVKDAHETWALSRFTLPHRVARLIVCEQMYRAFTILRGEPYHK